MCVGGGVGSRSSLQAHGTETYGDNFRMERRGPHGGVPVEPGRRCFLITNFSPAKSTELGRDNLLAVFQTGNHS